MSLKKKLGEHWRKLKYKGSGAFSQAYVAERKSDGMKVTLKVRDGDREEYKRIKQRIREVQKVVEDEFIQRCYSTLFLEKENKIVLECEWFPYSLSDIVSEMRHACNLEERVLSAINISIDIGRALEKFHYFKLCHGDLNPGNILNFGERWVLGDFEFSQSPGLIFTTIGAFPFRAPELETEEKPLTLKSDIFSFGALMYYILTEEYLFNSEKDKLRSYEYILSVIREKLDYAPQKLCTLIANCVKQNPRLRPNIEDVLHELEVIKGSILLKRKRIDRLKQKLDEEEKRIKRKELLRKKIKRLVRSVALICGISAAVLFGYFGYERYRKVENEIYTQKIHQAKKLYLDGRLEAAKKLLLALPNEYKKKVSFLLDKIELALLRQRALKEIEFLIKEKDVQSRYERCLNLFRALSEKQVPEIYAIVKGMKERFAEQYRSLFKRRVAELLNSGHIIDASRLYRRLESYKDENLIDDEIENLRVKIVKNLLERWLNLEQVAGISCEIVTPWYCFSKLEIPPEGTVFEFKKELYDDPKYFELYLLLDTYFKAFVNRNVLMIGRVIRSNSERKLNLYAYIRNPLVWKELKFYLEYIGCSKNELENYRRFLLAGLKPQFGVSLLENIKKPDPWLKESKILSERFGFGDFMIWLSLILPIAGSVLLLRYFYPRILDLFDFTLL